MRRLLQAFLTRLAQSSAGAQALFRCSLISRLSDCSFLAMRPETVATRNPTISLRLFFFLDESRWSDGGRSGGRRIFGSLSGLVLAGGDRTLSPASTTRSQARVDHAKFPRKTAPGSKLSSKLFFAMIFFLDSTFFRFSASFRIFRKSFMPC